MSNHQVAVVGGNGQIARLLHPLLTAAGATPVALVRAESQRAGLEALGAEVRLFDIEEQVAGDLAPLVADCAAIVFAAGGGPDGNIVRKRTVDLGGALTTIAAARAAGVRRLVQVSAIGVDEEVDEDSSPVWAAYVEAKRDADAALRESGLDWTIVRPGALTDEPGTGRVAAAPEVERSAIPRADVAAVIAAVLADDSSIGKQFELVSGETPIVEAVAALS